MGAVPHNMWRASGGVDGPTGLSPATGSLDLPFPPMTCCGPLLGPCGEELRRRCCRCAPEGALAAAFPPYMHVSLPCSSSSRTVSPPPGARAPGCAALLLPDMKLTAAGVLPKVLLHCVSSCAVPPAAPAPRWSVCPLPCCVRAVLPAACAALLAVFLRCVLAREALAYLSRLPPALVDCCRCTPEGTPALCLLLRRAACCPCTTLVGMSPPVLRACRAACCLRCSFQEANRAPAWRWRVARAPLLDACHHSQPPEHRFKEADTLVSHVLSLRSDSQRRIQPLQ